MKHQTSISSYEERIQRVVLHIREHMDEELDLDRLADVACMSRYHWHRVFKAMTGKTLAVAVRQIRLERAAEFLIHESSSIQKVAQQVGFKNVSSFTRAFKTAYGLPPNEFRERGIPAARVFSIIERELDVFPVLIKELKSFRAAGVRHIGPYPKIGKAFKTLGEVLLENSLLPKVNALFAVYHDLPDCGPSSELTSHVAVAIGDTFPEGLDKLDYFEIEGGRFAVLEHLGPYPNLNVAYEWLYGTWLPSSGEEPKDLPPMEFYLNDPKTTPAQNLRTDIRLPLV